MKNFMFGLAFGALLIVLVSEFFEKYTVYYRHGYKQGQIDCLEGKIKYKKGVIWEEIKP